MTPIAHDPLAYLAGYIAALRELRVLLAEANARSIVPVCDRINRKLQAFERQQDRFMRSQTAANDTAEATR